MRTKSKIFAIVVLTLMVTCSYAQENSNLRMYSLGNYGIELTLDDKWKLSNVSKDYFEILYGCSESQNCANIQIVFQKGYDPTAMDLLITYVIKRQKRNYPGLVYTKSKKTINNIQFDIVDFLIRTDGQFLGQTLALFTANDQLVNFTFTGSLVKNDKQASTTYARERAQFMNILNEMKLTDVVRNAGDPSLIVQCNDSTSFLVAQKDDFRCFIKLIGDTQQLTEKTVSVNGRALRTFLGYKKPFLEDENVEESDGTVLMKFTYLLSAKVFFTAYPHKSKHFFHTQPVKMPNDKEAFFWYASDLTPKKLKQLKRGEIDNAGAVLGNVFVSIVVEDYIYSIQFFDVERDSIEEVRLVLTELLKSMEYTREPVDIYNPCSQFEVM